MKDYYYFLGIPHDATDEEIKKAYRKLSLKYHPDKNENDEFFEARFREIQEAYDFLSDREQRKAYDANLESSQRAFRYNIPPTIQSFSANKIHAKKDEEIIITWRTSSADLVKIHPFGLEKSYGERIFKITEFKDGKFQLLLHATNSVLHKTAVQGITISEVFEQSSDKYRSEAEQIFASKNNNPIQANKIQRRRIQLIIAILCFLLAAYFFMQK